MSNICPCPNCMARYEAEAYLMDRLRDESVNVYERKFDTSELPKYGDPDKSPSWLSQNWKGCISVTLIIIMVVAEAFRWWLNS